jgi:ABC-2 type transport system ATP-binding protein
VLVSSHMLAEVAQTIDSVLIIDCGRLVAQGPVEELTAGGSGLEEVFFQLTREAAR